MPRGSCVWILRDETRCTNVAVDGDLCRPHAKKAAEGQLEAESVAVVEPELLEAEDEPDEIALGVNREERIVSDLRAALTEDATGHYAKLWDLIEGALVADKQTYATCVHCHRRTPVTVADFNARIQAAKLLIEQTAGKPAAPESTAKGTLEGLRRRVDDLHGKRFSEMTDEELLAIILYDYASDPDGEVELAKMERRQQEVRAVVASGGDSDGGVIELASQHRVEDGFAALTPEQIASVRERGRTAEESS